MSKKKPPIIIAVDGPAGSGKSSICSATAKKLGWDYLSSGIIYRIVAYLTIKENLSLDDSSKVVDLIDKAYDKLEFKKGSFFYDNKDLSDHLLLDSISQAASSIATRKEVRQKLLPLQRNITCQVDQGVIIDGRDIGTVVFPNADLKIYMTASVKTRALRRYTQITSSGKTSNSLDKYIKEIATRDKRDSERSESPLLKADDAIEFDTSNIGFTECVDDFYKLIFNKFLK